ncbi:unnamed protein product [Urochloa humidicola]
MFLFPQKVRTDAYASELQWLIISRQKVRAEEQGWPDGMKERPLVLYEAEVTKMCTKQVDKLTSAPWESLSVGSAAARSAREISYGVC